MQVMLCVIVKRIMKFVMCKQLLIEKKNGRLGMIHNELSSSSTHYEIRPAFFFGGLFAFVLFENGSKPSLYMDILYSHNKINKIFTTM